MDAFVAMIAILMVFGLPMYAVKRRYDLREKLREGDGASRKELEDIKAERKLLAARIENLETIVCSVDHELNARLERLLDEQSRIGGALAAAPEKRATGPDRGNGNGSGDGHGEVHRASAGVAATMSARSSGAAVEQSIGRTESTALDVRRVTPRSAPSPAPSEELQPGQVLDQRYRIERSIGRGGMGAVYLAHDEVLGELVALKVISSARCNDPIETAHRFRREASAARRVLSPHVIRIHDLGQTRDGLLFISMEYFAGRTLAEFLDTRGALPIAELRDIIGQVCDGLGAAHDAGVIHRDLKPQNILVGERRAVKIIDFGLAKSTFLHGMTATGLIMGTPHYMSPEQVKGLEVDARSDIYALGALTFHAATGQPPFDGKTPIAVGFAHLTEPARDPHTIRGDLPPELCRAIVAALAKEPGERPRSAAEFKGALG